MALLGALATFAIPCDARGQASERRVALDEAVRIALRHGAEARIAAARREAAEGRAREATSALYPSVRLETGVMRSSDPVAAFGTRL
ncbi:MAG: hypothetical protein R3266_11465, partial [Gemmatimonadota bacterium]|nr:hypothetical protein [Gemmatimonadota bacterium]